MSLPLIAESWISSSKSRNRWSNDYVNGGCRSSCRAGGNLRLSIDASTTESSFKVEEYSGDEKSIYEAATFLVDSFWLGSPRQQTDASITVSSIVKAALVDEQAVDLLGKYGERMGKPLLKNCLLMAKDGNDKIVGFVCLQELLLDKNQRCIYSADVSEDKLNSATSSLGPKQRRQYQKSSAKELADALLPPDQESVVCFSNLSISMDMRRKGIAAKLCLGLEQFSTNWGYDSIFLKVESENESARTLYTKLGYVDEFPPEPDTAIRLDTTAGEFIEIETPTIIMRKSLQ